MPLPRKGKKESKKDFVSRCMSDPKVNEEFPDNDQRFAVCNNQSKSLLELMDDQIKIDPCGEESEAAYIYEHPKTGEMFTYRRKGIYKKDGIFLIYKGKASESQGKKPGLWDNIRKKKEKEGKDYKPAKPGDPDRPDPESWKKAQKPKKKAESAKYQGRKVTLNKPFRTPKGPKKFSVYVKNDKDNVVKVNFGDPDMEIKRDDPKRRKSFRARHKCDNPGPKWKARYWSCWQWRASSPVKGDE